MKPTRFLFTALILCGITFGLAFAANAEDSKPIEPILEQKPVSFSLLSRDAFNWSGFYIGGNIGGILNNYNISRYSTDVDTVEQFEETLFFLEGTASGTVKDRPASGTIGNGLLEFFSDEADSHNGPQEGTIMGGGQLGGQFQFGHFVFGLEGDIDRVATSASRHFVESDSTSFDFKGDIAAITELQNKRRVETDWTGSLRGRLGYAQGPFLFYATGGVSFADVTMWSYDRASTIFVDGLDGAAPPPNLVLGDGLDILSVATNSNLSKDHEVQVGWTAGAGIEFALTQMLTIGLEYRHSDYGDDSYHFSSHDGPIVPGHSHVDFESDQVSMRVNVLLNQFFGHSDGGMASNEKISDSSLTMAGMSAKDKTVEPVIDQFSWTGPYFGAHIGGIWNDYDFGGYDTDVDVLDQFGPVGMAAESSRVNGAGGAAHTAKNAMLDQQVIVNGQSLLSFHTPGLDGTSDDSIMGGIQAGYNFQFGHFVFGVEGDWSGMTSDGHSPYFTSTVTTIDFFDEEESATTDLTTYRRAETNWTASGRGRLGWANGRLMLYGTGGVAVADVTVRATDSARTIFFSEDDALVVPVGSSIDAVVSSQNLDHEDNLQVGWTAGGGAEWAAKDTVSFALEYRHNDFGGDSYHIDKGHNASPINPGNTHLDLDSDQMTLRVNILLGHLGK